MNDISVIEWAVYGLVAYGTILINLVAMVKEVPNTRDMALTRVFLTIPGLILNGVLATSGNVINFLTTTATHTTNTINGTTGIHLTNSTTTDLVSNQITLVSPVWIMVHMMFFTMLLWVIITQIMFIMKHPEN